MAIDLKTKSIYSFEVYPVPILGSSFFGVTVLVGSMTEEVARAQGFNTAEMHAQVYPFIPAEVGCPDDPSAYDYALIKTQTGEKAILGIPWIKESSIQLITSQQLRMVVDSVSTEDIQKIRNAMASMGFNNVTYSVG